MGVLALTLTVLAEDPLPFTAGDSRGNLIVPGALGQIVYRRIDGVELALDAYSQRTGDARPAVLVLHGGGGTSGSRRTRIGQILETLTHGGFNWIAIDYRLGPRFDRQAALDDVRVALDFIRAHASQLRLDPRRLAILGEDFGADLALLLAHDKPPGVQAIVAMGGLYAALGDPPTALPPTLLVHGADDREVPPARPEACRDARRSHQNLCELLLLDGAIHAVQNWRPEAWVWKVRVNAWLAERLQLEEADHVPHGGRLRKNLVYGHHLDAGGKREPLRLDAFVPEGQGPFAAVIIVHGGGWEAGDKVTYVTPVLEPLARAGLAWFSIDYRLTPAHGHEVQRQDVRRAVRYIRYFARELRVDPDRLALLGESAGAQLALSSLAGELAGDPQAFDPIDRESCAVRAVVSLYGVYDLEALSPDAGPRSLAHRFFGAATLDDTTRSLLREHSPLFQARPGLPPILLVHGSAEKLWEQGVSYSRKLSELGLEHELYKLEGAPHGMESWEGHAEWSHWKEKLTGWLGQELAAPARPGPQGFPELSQLEREPPVPPRGDWLIDGSPFVARVHRGREDHELVLTNGLVRRVFRLQPEVATVALDQVQTGVSVLRAIKPEASVTINAVEHAVGGLTGQHESAYLSPAAVREMVRNPGSYTAVGLKISPAAAPFSWKRARPAPAAAWPPAGLRLTFRYQSPAKDVEVLIHYELFDGLPVICKWLEVENHGSTTVTLDSFQSEILAVVEAESAVDERKPGDWRLPDLLLLSDYSFKGMDQRTANRTTHWLPDPDYSSQVSYSRQTPTLVVSRPPLGPAARVEPKGRFESFRTFLLVFDASDRERQGLTLRRTLRRVAPWVTENPILMHVRSSQSIAFRAAVDQCAEVGFEMVIYTFGSGLDMENEDPSYLARIKSDVDYAHSRGIEVGAYSLLSSRSIGPLEDAINPQTGKPGGAIFGNAPCLMSRWGEEYFRKVRRFLETTGLDCLEHDGPYPGDVCASRDHPGHAGLEDSQWLAWQVTRDFYRWCRQRGIYLNIPDYYILAGSSKVAMGYRETNWSLPRERQVILARQNIFDGTWEKTPSMGWMFVPLVEYHGGGPAATLEPLKDHLDTFEAHFANLFGAGVQACWRGPRLYDAPETKELVVKWVKWFKERREILESDLIHLRRADGRDWDGWLHVNARTQLRGLAMIYNPLDVTMQRTVRLPLQLTGLVDQATVRIRDGQPVATALARDFTIAVEVQIGPRGHTWITVE